MPAKINRVINIKNHDQYDIYIGRGSIFGNPYTHLPLHNTSAKYKVNSIKDAVMNYKIYFDDRIENDSRFLLAVSKLHGKTLGCYCVKHPISGYTDPDNIICHGQIIVNFLEMLYEEETNKETS